MTIPCRYKTILLSDWCPLEWIGRSEKRKRACFGPTCHVHDARIICDKEIKLVNNCGNVSDSSVLNNRERTLQVLPKPVHSLTIPGAGGDENAGITFPE